MNNDCQESFSSFKQTFNIPFSLKPQNILQYS